MKRLKQADFYGQLLLLLVFFITSCVNGFMTLMIGYFVLGAWQLTSMAVHFYNDWHMHRHRKRYQYFYFSIIAILLLCGGFLFPTVLLLVFVVMFFAAPVMALYYAFLCYKEVFHAYKRPSEIIF